MSMARCDSCDRVFDTDFYVEGQECGVPYCHDCYINDRNKRNKEWFGDEVNYDYKGALKEVYSWSPNIPTKSHIKTIIQALKLADRVTGEPSKEMISEGVKARDEFCTVSRTFKAMVSKAVKEVSDE